MLNQSFWVNHNWYNENLTCHFCGNTQSVKYKTKVVIVDTIPNSENTEKEVCICNKCALCINNLIDVLNNSKKER